MTKVYLKNQVRLDSTNFDKATNQYSFKLPTNYLGELNGVFTWLVTPKNFNGNNIVAEIVFAEIEQKFPISIREGEYNNKKQYNGTIKLGDEKVAWINVFKKLSENETPSYDVIIAEKMREEKEDEDLGLPF